MILSNLKRSVASFTKNKSPAVIIFLSLKLTVVLQNSREKKIIADRKIFATRDLFLVKLASDQYLWYLISPTLTSNGKFTKLM